MNQKEFALKLAVEYFDKNTYLDSGKALEEVIKAAQVFLDFIAETPRTDIEFTLE